MKNSFNLITNLVLLLLIFSCKNEDPISYAEAMAAIQPETITQDAANGRIILHNYYDLQRIVGALLPSIEAVLLTGDTLRESYFDGKVTVVNLWFIGCKPCEAEIPGFNKLVEKYKFDPVNFLAISRNSHFELNEFFTENPFRADHIPFGHKLIEEVFQSKWGFPLTLIADKNQKIIAAFSGGRIDSLAAQELQDKLIPVIDGALR